MIYEDIISNVLEKFDIIAIVINLPKRTRKINGEKCMTDYTENLHLRR